MRNLTEVTGMVLRVMPVGERNRRVTVLTMEQGKLSFFAHGAGKPGSPFMGATRPFSYGKFSLFQGRDSFSLEAAEIQNYFEAVSRDVESTCYGSYFLEMADAFSREFAPEPRLLRLLYRALLALTKESLPRELVRRIFELRVLVTDGVYDPEPPLPGAEKCRYTWHYVCMAPEEKLFRFTVTDEILREFGENVDASLHRYLDREMHSLEILKRMMGESL